MKQLLRPSEVKLESIEDRITGDTIILRDQEKFCKRIIIISQSGHKREYVFFKTKGGGYILNKSF